MKAAIEMATASKVKSNPKRMTELTMEGRIKRKIPMSKVPNTSKKLPRMRGDSEKANMVDEFVFNILTPPPP
jgi:hypothetical protein